MISETMLKMIRGGHICGVDPLVWYRHSAEMPTKDLIAIARAIIGSPHVDIPLWFNETSEDDPESYWSVDILAGEVGAQDVILSDIDRSYAILMCFAGNHLDDMCDRLEAAEKRIEELKKELEEKS